MKELKVLAYEAINKPLNLFGLELTVSRKAQAFLHKRLRWLRNLGFDPDLIFDTGSFVGHWTANAAPFFPNATFVLIEPNPNSMRAARERLAGHNPPPVFFETAVGAGPGVAHLNVWSKEAGQGASLLSHVAGSPCEAISINVTTLDAIASQLGRFPQLVKLDLQGFEVEALKGASRILLESRVLIVEFGCLPAYVGRATPRDLIDRMYDAGYVLYDVVDLLYRPYDNALTGGDFVFIKRDDELRKYPGYE